MCVKKKVWKETDPTVHRVAAGGTGLGEGGWRGRWRPWEFVSEHVTLCHRNNDTAQGGRGLCPVAGAFASWAMGFPTSSSGVRRAVPSERSDRSEDVVTFPGSEQNFDVLGCTQYCTGKHGFGGFPSDGWPSFRAGVGKQSPASVPVRWPCISLASAPRGETVWVEKPLPHPAFGASFVGKINYPLDGRCYRSRLM